MREGDIRFDRFQAKTESSSGKTTHDGDDDEMFDRSQTRAIGFGGRKGEKPTASRMQHSVESRLKYARKSWTANGDASALRSILLKLLLVLDSEGE